MYKPTKKQSSILKARITALINAGMSLNEIARETGKSPQAVHQYLRYHGLETAHMRRRRIFLDKEKREVDGAGAKGGHRDE